MQSLIYNLLKDEDAVKFVFYQNPESKGPSILKQNELEVIHKDFTMWSVRRCKMLYREKLVGILEIKNKWLQRELRRTRYQTSKLRNPYSKRISIINK